MKEKKKIFRTSLLCIALVAIGSLLYAGFAPFTGQDLSAQFQQDQLNLEVPVIQQSLGTSCGEAAIVMAYNYAYPQTPISEQEAIDYATSQGYFTEDLPPYTSPANMVKIAEFYADDVSSGTVRDSDQGLRLLVQNLQSGSPVIIDVLSNFTDPGSEAHFVVVTGLSVDPNRENEIIVHFNDPLTGAKVSAAWSGAEGLWNAWQNNGDPGGPGWWLTIPPLP
jgi:hypothetical protein